MVAVSRDEFQKAFDELTQTLNTRHAEVSAQMEAFKQLFNGADQAVRILETTFGARLTISEELVQHAVDEVHQHIGQLQELV